MSLPATQGALRTPGDSRQVQVLSALSLGKGPFRQQSAKKRTFKDTKLRIRMGSLKKAFLSDKYKLPIYEEFSFNSLLPLGKGNFNCCVFIFTEGSPHSLHRGAWFLGMKVEMQGCFSLAWMRSWFSEEPPQPWLTLQSHPAG